MRVGAMIGTRGRADLDQFIRFGFFLGAAFQIQDDLLNLAADHRYGKEALGDLFEEAHMTLIHAFRLRGAPAERAKLKIILGASRSERRADDVVWIRSLMERHESSNYARKIGHGLAGAALHEFAAMFGRLPASRDKDFLRGLVTWIFERT